MEKILVTGGAGYIGSHLVLMLSQLGYDVITYDDLSSGSAEAVLGGRLIIGNLADTEKLEQLFAQELFDAVIHLAAVSQVHQSMSMPDLYYNINVIGSINLLDCVKTYKIKSFIFSSNEKNRRI